MYSKGLEMLKIFKNHHLKTSLLDDFIYYENRQKIMLEEKTKLLIRSFENPLMLPTLEPPRKLNFVVDIPPVSVEIGSIPLDPRTLQLDGGTRVKNGS